jgi:prepilin signal peptidase PulO-like enzyme (type II secretory pathway)
MNKRRNEPVDDVALGFGDVNLAGILGLLLGFPGIVVGLTLGALIGGAGSLLFILLRLAQGRYRSMDALPYGPFLISGAVLLLFFPDFLKTIFK